MLGEKVFTLELLSSMEIYDPKTNRWLVGASMHQGRQIFPAAFGPDGKLYVFGGYGHLGEVTQKEGESEESYRKRIEEMDRVGTYALSSVEAYDPKTDTWAPRAPMLVGMEGSGAALGADGKIYVVGGTRNFPNPLPERLVQVYDPLRDTWSKGPYLNPRRQGLAVVSTTEGRIYAIGGTSEYSAFHPRMLVGGEPWERGGPLASVEVLETAPRK
jgi:N-acetylneuraminic acid mutarotase